MSVGLPSEEVAEDYKNSLEDLTLNSRAEISNLTVIAKENVEHAMAICRVLENHIRNTPPDRKLPALYVLDSIVKNVGTPYTLYLGRNLYSIFMNAYTLVNGNVRRKLDEMLKTWKERVPGSMDPRPVFSAETTRPIENALIKARTAAIQQQQQQQARTQQELMARQRPLTAPNTQWRSTITPPQANGRYYPPVQQVFAPQVATNDQYQSRPQFSPQNQYSPPQHTAHQYPQPFQQPPYSQNIPVSHHVDPLNKDIAELVRTTREQLAANVYDQSLNSRLQALLALQGIMSQQQLPPEQLRAVRDQITALSAPPSQPTVPPSYVPPPQIPQHQFLPQHQRPMQIQHTQPPQTPELRSPAPSSNLADIIAKAQRPAATPPVPQVSFPQSQTIPAAHIPAPSLPGDLLATLRANGFLTTNSNTPTNGTPGYVPPPPVKNTPSIPPVGSQRPNFINDVELTSASLKISRPHLISTLYEARSNQCTTCGKRFLATQEGKEKKAKHLDWHFRTNQRLADSAKRGQSRSWYVDELEWIKSRENPEDTIQTDTSSTASKAALTASLAAADPRNKHIPVPSDPALANQPCPICQERFDTTWNDEAQDFVWNDAIQIGSRIFHASCHAEAKMDGGNTPGRTSTPDSVLGKRKAAVAGVSDIIANNPKAIKA